MTEQKRTISPLASFLVFIRKGLMKQMEREARFEQNRIMQCNIEMAAKASNGVIDETLLHLFKNLRLDVDCRSRVLDSLLFHSDANL